MSRVRRLSFAITEDGRRSAAIIQAKKLRDATIKIVDDANQSVNFSTLRRVTKRAAFTVVLRSLERTTDLPFALREHMALKELSSYITLAQHNKNTSLTFANTDLLPISHPRSTREHSLTASALKQARVNWVSDDPRITDENVKTILASALMSAEGSVAHVYYSTLLASLPQGQVPLEALTAAFGDGNSTAARRARAMLQRRDRKGRFAYQGGGLKALIRRSDGLVYSLTGRQVSDAQREGFIQIETSDGKILEVPVAKGEFVKAVLPTPDGYDQKPVAVNASDLGDVLNEADLKEVAAPNGWDYEPDQSVDGGKQVWSDGAFEVAITTDANGKKKYDLHIAELGHDEHKIDTFDSWAGVQDRLRGNEAALAEIPEDLDIKNRGKSVDDLMDKVDRAPVKDTVDEAPEFDPEEDVIKGDESGPSDEEITAEPKKKKGSKKEKSNLPVATKNSDGEFEFSYPDGAYKITPGQTYTPKANNDDPVELAQRFSADELIFALSKGLSPSGDGKPGTGYGELDFGKGPEPIAVEALHNALKEQGEDADGQVANIYDDIAGNNDNFDKLEEFRNPSSSRNKNKGKGKGKGKKSAQDVSEIFESVTQGKPDVADAPEVPIDETPAEEEPFPALLDGLSSEEKQSIRESGDHTPYLPTNAQHTAPEGYYQIDSEPYSGWETSTEENPHDVLPVGASSNPVFLANHVDTPDLMNELRRGLEPSSDAPGYGVFGFLDDADEEHDVNIPVEAIRDALQLQGVDTDAEIEKVYDEGRLPEPIAEIPEDTSTPTPVEEPSPTPEPTSDSKLHPDLVKKLEARAVPVEPSPEDSIKEEDLTPEQRVRREIRKSLVHENLKGDKFWGQEHNRQNNAARFGEISDKQVASLQKALADFPDGPEKQAVLDSLDGKHGDKLNGMMFKSTASKIIGAVKDWEASKKETPAVDTTEKSATGLPLTGEILDGKVQYSIGDQVNTTDSLYRTLTLKGDLSPLAKVIDSRKSKNFRVVKESNDEIEIQVHRMKSRYPKEGNTKGDIDFLLGLFERMAAPSKSDEPTNPDIDKSLESLKSAGAEDLSFRDKNGTEVTSPVLMYLGRPIILTTVNGVKIPFYVSTGMGGKEKYGIPSGEWLPSFGTTPNGAWMIKGTVEEIKNSYGVEDLKKKSDLLNETVGDIRTLKGDIPEVIDGEELRRVIGGDIDLESWDLVGAEDRNSHMVLARYQLEIAVARLKGDKDAEKSIRASLEDFKSRFTPKADATPEPKPTTDEAPSTEGTPSESPVAVSPKPENKEQEQEQKKEQESAPSDNKEEDSQTPPEEPTPTPEEVNYFTEEVKKDGWTRVEGPGLAWQKGNWTIRLSDGYGGVGFLASYRGMGNGRAYIRQIQSSSYSGMKDRINADENDRGPQGPTKRAEDLIVGDEIFVPGMGWKKVVDVQKDAETGDTSVAYEDTDGGLIYEWFGRDENISTKSPEDSSKDAPEAPKDENVDAEGNPLPPEQSNKKSPHKIVPGEEVYIPGVGWRIALRSRKHVYESDKVGRKPTIRWSVDYADQDGVIGSWWTSTAWYDKPDNKLATRPAGTLAEEAKIPTPVKSERVEGEEASPQIGRPALPAPTVEEAITAKTPRKTSAKTTELQPGDVMSEDHFTITKIEEGHSKKRDGSLVPASRVSGYYPGGVEQSTKLWADDVVFDIFRDVTPPQTGDLPELSKPTIVDYGKITKVNGKWELRDPDAQKKFDQDMEKYIEKLDSQKSMWSPPENIESVVKEFTLDDTLHVISALGKDLKPNDIAFRRDGEELGEFFVIEEVLPGTIMVPRADKRPAEEKVQIRGYYPGHQSQIKSWKIGTEVEVLRGEKLENIPAKGDKPGIDSIEPGTLKGKAYQDKNAEISAARRAASAGYKPSITTSSIPKSLIEKPTSRDIGQRPGFFGSAAELADLKDGKAIWSALQDKKVVYFDFETVGKGFDHDNPDAPIQVAASRYEGGVKVGEINLFINPGEPLGNYYYKTNEDGTKVLDPAKLLSADGVVVDDDFLSTQPSLEEQLRKLSEFMGTDSILVAHKAEFDTNTFEHWATKLGIDYKISGVIDTLELARSMVPRGNTLKEVADRYGVVRDEKDWHDARTDSDVLPAILEGLLGDMAPDNKEFDVASRMATFRYKRSLYNEKMEAWKKQQSELASAEVVKKVMSGGTATLDDLLSPTSNAPTPVFGPDGSTDSAEEYKFESIYGGIINNSWVEDDENTFIVGGDGLALVGDIQVGDFVPALNGGYHEVVLVRPDPDSDWGVIVVRRIIETGELYSERVTEKKSPGRGWDLRKTLIGTLRRRNEFGGKSRADASLLASKPIQVATQPSMIDEISVPDGKENVTVQDTISTVSDAIESITSGESSASTVEEAVKSLPISEKTKAAVLTERGDSSPNHLSADGTPLRVGDPVMGTKTRRIGEVRGIISEYGPRGYKNYLRVWFADTGKSENISAGSLRVINSDEGAVEFVDKRKKTSMGPIDPNTAPIPEETLSSLLSGEVPEGTPSVEIPEEPVVHDPEEKAREWKQREEERMAYALEKNYRQVSPEALDRLTKAVSETAAFDEGYKVSFTAFMPNFSTGEPLERTFTFVKPSKKDLSFREDYLEPDDTMVMTGPNNLAAIIKSDGKILYFESPAAPNWKFSVVSPDLMSALESKNDLGIPQGDGFNIQKMGMISLDSEFPDAEGSPDDATPNADFVESVPDTSSKGITPTAQQQAVIDAVVAGKDVIVQALAGTGKTSTLKMAARAIAEKFPKKRILYIAFNKAVAAELNADPDRPTNMIARTNTQVAWHHSPKWMQQRSFDKTSISMPGDAADHLKMVSVPVTEIKKDGSTIEANLSSREVSAIVRQAVIAFAQSSDPEVAAHHFTENIVEVPQQLIDYANLWWADISSPTGRLAMNQSFPEKYVQLNGIDVRKFPEDTTTNPLTAIPASDTIFFDEAQDINDVAADWVRKQKVQKVFVGDGNQSIYGFRGAKDQLDTLEGAEKLQITESFRFGPNIAAQANKFLAISGKTEKVIGAGKTEGTIVQGMEHPDAVLVRTNGGGFKAMLEYLEQGKVVGISQSTKTRLEEVIDTASWLMGGKKGKKPLKYNAEIGMYDSWEELSTAVKEGRGRPVKALYELITFNGIQGIRDILDRVVVEREETAESKIALSKYRPLTIDKIKDGYTDKLSKDVTYRIEGNDVVVTGFFKFINDKLKEAGFIARKNPDGTWANDRRITLEDDQRKLSKLNQLKKILEGVIEPVKADVVVTTAHQAKGLQWNKVRIYDDFWGPRLSKETAELVMPAPEELRLAYVALTRAQKELDMGPLVWVNDYVPEEEDQASGGFMGLQAMADIPTDPTPVTPDELSGEIVETSKSMDPATKKIADSIIAALEAGTAPWRKPWSGSGIMPTSVATGKMYEGSNILVLWAAQTANGWEDNRWLTYNQAVKLGGHIRRGEKSTSIIHWTPRFKDVIQPDGSTDKVFVYTPPKVISVFNVEQAEGISLPPLVRGEPVPISEAEQTILDAYKDRPEIFYKSQDQAYYSPATDTIHLPLREQFGSEQDLFETLVHELAHSTARVGRADRASLVDNYGSHKESRGEEELIAEISVALVAARLGVEIDFGNVAAYAQSWLKALKNDPTMIIKAAKQAQKAVDHMLGKQESSKDVDAEGNPIEPTEATPNVPDTIEPTPKEDAAPSTVEPEADVTPQVTSKGYVKSKTSPTDLRVGDRLDIAGKTRVSSPPKTMSDGSIVVGTRTIGSKGGGIREFTKDQEVNVWRKPEPTPTPTEDNVGSDGKTGEEISSAPKEAPTPEPNVGEQGKSGEDISPADRTPKNIKPGVEVSTHTINGTTYPLWDDIEHENHPPSDPNIEAASGRTFRAVMAGEEVLTDKFVIGAYVTQILTKYGYGDRLFDFNMDSAETYFNAHPELNHIEAGVGRAQTDLLPDNHPLKDKILPALMIRKRGTTRPAILHEIAHMMEGNWIAGDSADDGHNSVWYATWVTLLKLEGFTTAANILEQNAGKLKKGDTGVLRP